MSEQIDWSKAPADATHCWAQAQDFFKLDHGNWMVWYWNEMRWAKSTIAERWSGLVERTTTPSWSGEGLPPVGVVCEYCCVNDKWRQVKVIAHMIEMQKDNPCAVSQLGDTGPLCIGGASSFRPIRTPEQIEKDERQAAVKDMMSHIYACLPRECWDESGPACFTLYDAGYRKP